MNLTADQPCGHAVFMPSQYAGKPERLKNPCLILLYTYYSFPTVCSNYLALAAPTSLDLSSLNSHQPHRVTAARKGQFKKGFLRLLFASNELARDSLQEAFLDSL